MDTAEHIKTKLIRWLLKGSLSFNKRKDCIATEILFSRNRRKADLLIISNCLHTLEIKSHLDDIRKLKSQLVDYQKTFDLVSVVTTDKHIKGILKTLPQNTGLFLFENEKFKIIRKPKRNKRLDKLNLLMFFDKNTLLKSFKIRVKKNFSTDQIRLKIAQKKELREIKKMTYLSLKSYYAKMFKMFLRDTGGKIIWDELRGLTGKTNKIYF